MGINYSEVQNHVGKESEAIMAIDKVSKSDIRHWCELIDQDDTPYTEINWEEKTVPPAMLMVWTMPPLWSPESKAPTAPHELALKVIDDAGYDGAIGIALDQEIFAPVKVDDRLSYTVKLNGVSSDEVQTNMGKGYQVDLEYKISNQTGKMISKQNYSLFKFKILNPVTE